MEFLHNHETANRTTNQSNAKQIISVAHTLLRYKNSRVLQLTFFEPDRANKIKN